MLTPPHHLIRHLVVWNRIHTSSRPLLSQRLMFLMLLSPPPPSPPLASLAALGQLQRLGGRHEPSFLLLPLSLLLLPSPRLLLYLALSLPLLCWLPLLLLLQVSLSLWLLLHKLPQVRIADASCHQTADRSCATAASKAFLQVAT